MASKTFEIRKTGGEVDMVVFNLIKHAYDESEPVRLSILYSLMELSHHQPELVSTSIASYVSKHSSTIDSKHRVQLHDILSQMLSSDHNLLSSQVAQDIVDFASQEMTATDEAKTELPTAASSVLVNISLSYPAIVIRTLLNSFKPGTEPHYYVIRTLNELSSSNPIETVLHLRDILSRFIPVLGLIKSSPLRWIFSSAMGRFSESIHFFTSNATNEQKSQVDLGALAHDFASAFDVFISKWLQDPQNKVRSCVLESLGYICSVLGPLDFSSRFSQLITIYLERLRVDPPKEHLGIALGLSCALGKSVTDDISFNNHAQYSLIMQTLHDQVAVSNTQSINVTTNPILVKTAAELLRSWEILSRALPDLSLTFIISKFQLKSTSTRISSLIILRHLVNSIDSILMDRRSLILSSVTTLVNEPGTSLRITILQLIASMANQGYLTLEGGQALLRFVAQQCSIKIPTKKDDDNTDDNSNNKSNEELEQLVSSARRILHNIATRVDSARDVLWPFLLELICDPIFNNGIVSILKAIYEVAKYKYNNNDTSYIVNLEQHVNIPIPQAITVRLFTLLSQPNKFPGLGIAVASASQFLGCSIHAPLGEYWQQTMPALVKHLEDNDPSSPSFSLSKWQDTTLKVYRESLLTIGSEAWLTSLVQEITRIMTESSKDSSLMRLLYRFLGATLSRIQNKLLIQQHIDLMLNTVKHNNIDEQRGCAQGIGMAANPHLDMVLPKLTSLLTTTPEHRKSTGFLGFGAKDLGPEDEVKATAVLAYGYTTAYANPSIIISRLELHILHNIIPLLGLSTVDGKKATNVVKPAPVLQVQLVKSIDLIGKTILPSRLPPESANYTLKTRDDLVHGILSMLQPSNSPRPELRLLALTTLSTLSRLQPQYTKDMNEKLFNVVIPAYYMLQDACEIPSTSSVSEPIITIPKSSIDKANGNDKSGKVASDRIAAAAVADGGETDDGTPGETLVAHIDALWQSLLEANPTIDMLLLISTQLQPLLHDKSPVVRKRSLTSYLLILKTLVPKLTQDKIKQKETCFPELGKRISFILARLSDSIDIIRSMAVECIQALLYIDQLLNDPNEIKPRPDVKSLTSYRTILGQTSYAPLGSVNWSDFDVVRLRYTTLDNIITIISNASTSSSTIEAIRSIISKLADPDIQASLGLSRILSKAVCLRGVELGFELKPCVQSFLATLCTTYKKETKLAVLQSLRLLAKMHFDSVMEVILSAPTPLPREYCEVITALSDPVEKILTSAGDWIIDQNALSFDNMQSNKELSKHLLEYLCNIINTTPLDINKPTQIVMTATCLLSTIFHGASGITSTASYTKTKPTTDGTSSTNTATSPTKGKDGAVVKSPESKTSSKKQQQIILHDDDISPSGMSWVFNYNPTQDVASSSALQIILQDNYPLLLSTILMRIGTSWAVHRPTNPDDTTLPKQISLQQSLDTLKAFLPAVSQNAILVSFDDVKGCIYRSDAHKHDILNTLIIQRTSDLFESFIESCERTLTRVISKNTKKASTQSYGITCDDLVAIIVRMTTIDRPKDIVSLIKCLKPFLSQQAYPGQRHVASAILAEFVNHLGLAELSSIRPDIETELIRILLPRINDVDDIVRKQSLRAMGNLVLVWDDTISSSATSIITSCSGATEDSHVDVAAEAVSSLQRISSVVSHDIITPLLISICFRVKPAFDHKDAKVRQAAFLLFTQLCRFGINPLVPQQQGSESTTATTTDTSINDNFLEQVMNNVPSYLVHMCDPDDTVKEYAFNGFRSIATLLSPEILSYINDNYPLSTNTDDDNSKIYKLSDLDDFNTYSNNITRLLAIHHVDSLRSLLDGCIGYYTSQWHPIRASAAYMTGTLIRHASLVDNARKRLNIPSLISSLVKLLDQDDSDVRNQTAKVLSLLHDI